MLKDHKALNEIISLSALISTFQHNNNDGSVKQYSVLAHILEDSRKHAIVFGNEQLVAKITEFVYYNLTLYASPRNRFDEHLALIGDQIVNLLLENMPGRFSTIVRSQGTS